MELKSKVCGYYKLEAVKIKDGKEVRRALTDWFPNIITNQGLDRIATNWDFLTYCQVGTGSTTPTASDTALGSRVGSASQSVGVVGSVNPTSPYYTKYTVTYRFGEGVAEGNISEVGVGWGTTGSLFSRALILDGEGSPTTVTVLSDEYLDVSYEYRFYPKETDTTGTLVFTGDPGGSYDFTMRPALIGSVQYLSGQSPANIVPVSMRETASTSYNKGVCRAYDGAIGVITTTPSGSYEELDYSLLVREGYTSGTYSARITLNAALGDLNLANGIKSFYFTFGPTRYQIEFDTVIEKTSSQVLSLTFTHVYERV